MGRWHLAPIADPLRIVGLAGMLPSGIFIFRALAANRYFSAVVRIQSDRGHRVIDGGPYGVIRHPGYVGMMLCVPFSACCSAPGLASGWRCCIRQ